MGVVINGLYFQMHLHHRAIKLWIAINSYTPIGQKSAQHFNVSKTMVVLSSGVDPLLLERLRTMRYEILYYGRSLRSFVLNSHSGLFLYTM